MFNLNRGGYEFFFPTEHVKALQKSRKETAILRSALAKSTRSLKECKQHWLTKFTSLQSTLTTLQTQHNALETLLTDYEKQFESIHAVAGDEVPLEGAKAYAADDSHHHHHPYPFLTHTTRLTTTLTTLRQQLTHLHAKLHDASHLASSRESAIEGLRARLGEDARRIEALQGVVDGQIGRIESLRGWGGGGGECDGGSGVVGG